MDVPLEVDVDEYETPVNPTISRETNFKTVEELTKEMDELEMSMNKNKDLKKNEDVSLEVDDSDESSYAFCETL